MKILVDVSKMQGSYIPHDTERNKPPERVVEQKKRNWKLIRRGINKGKYGRPVSFTHEQDMVILDMKRSGYTYKQMSEEMGRKPDAIRSRYYKLRDMGYELREKKMKGIKVYVTTMARPFQPEQFIAVYGTFKEAENSLRKEFPHMRKSMKENVYSSDKDSSYILFIHEREV